MKRGKVIQIAIMLLILLWSYASISKLIDLPEFRLQMLNQPFPEWMSQSLTLAIPLIELTIVLLLISPYRLAGLYCSFMLMLLFTGYVGLVLLGVFSRVPCSCGGVLENMSWEAHLVFNLLFSLIALAGIVLHFKERRLYDARSNLPG